MKPNPLDQALRLTHEAMNTTFALWFRGLDEASARGIARECFHHIDLLESRLSRFRDGSDVWRINRLEAGETLYLSDDCYQCLRIALEAHVRTGGLFDITLGARIRHRKEHLDGPAPPLCGRLVIHPDVPAVTCEEPGREIDLGGIGKGFALDELQRLLADWNVGDALIAAGASSLLAIGPETWPTELTGDRGQVLEIGLCGEALSASGRATQGEHIVHPDGEAGLPGRVPDQAWTCARSAAVAEVWSTALMLLDPAEVPEWTRGNGDLLRAFIAWDGRIDEMPVAAGGAIGGVAHGEAIDSSP
jgi:FAD:protein FMN transferase